MNFLNLKKNSKIFREMFAKGYRFLNIKDASMKISDPDNTYILMINLILTLNHHLQYEKFYFPRKLSDANTERF